jgi:hypothetical protein
MIAQAEKKKDPAEPILRNRIQKHAMRNLEKMKPFFEKTAGRELSIRCLFAVQSSEA